MEFISEGIFEKYSKMKILVFEIFEKGQILGPFSGLAPSKLKFLSKKFNGSRCEYRVFLQSISGESEVGGGGCIYRNKRGSERKRTYSNNSFVMILCLYAVFFCRVSEHKKHFECQENGIILIIHYSSLYPWKEIVGSMKNSFEKILNWDL